MHPRFKPLMALARLGASALFLVTVSQAQSIVNTSVGKEFDDAFTLHRARMGLTNVNGVASVAVTRADLYSRPDQMRLSATNLALGTVSVDRSNPSVRAVRVYVDTGAMPLRVQQAPGHRLALDVGSLRITNGPPKALQSMFHDPRAEQSLAIGVVTNLGSPALRSVEVQVSTPGIEIVR